jgi:uncharacterized protein with GYD domain
MIQASYVGEGLKGLLKEGGTKRKETVAQVIEGMGGILESFYYAFGDYDVVGVAEMPDMLSPLWSTPVALSMRRQLFCLPPKRLTKLLRKPLTIVHLDSNCPG